MIIPQDTFDKVADETTDAFVALKGENWCQYRRAGAWVDDHTGRIICSFRNFWKNCYVNVYLKDGILHRHREQQDFIRK